MIGLVLRRNFIAAHVAELPKSGIRAFFDIVATRKGVISLGVGEPDFATPWHIARKAETALREGQTHYTSNLGTPALRQEIAAYLKRRFGATYDAACEILVSVGVSEAIDLAIRAICEVGDEVLYHEPCFVSYAPTIRLAHATPVAVETSVKDAFRLTVAALEEKVTPRTKALLLNFPCNPTGATLSREDMEAIADFCIRHDILLLADEVYSELSYDEKPLSFSSIPRLKDRLILLNGFSKSWAMTGFRLGYACGPHDVIDAMMKIHQYGIMSAPTLSQAAGEEAMAHGDEDVVRMRAEYKRRRDFLVGALNQMGLPTLMPKGAFYLFPDIRPTGLKSGDFALRLLEEANVACVPGAAFGACGEGFVRMSYATSFDRIRVAAARIGKFVSGLIKPLTALILLAFLLGGVGSAWASDEAWQDCASAANGIIYVTDLSDGTIAPSNGTITLREAIGYITAHPTFADSDNACTIKFNSTVFNGLQVSTLKLTQSPFSFSGLGTRTLTIEGPSATQLHLDGAGKFRALSVSLGESVVVKNISFTNMCGSTFGAASTTAGGVIFNGGNFAAENCLFAGNQAGCAGVCEGGAIYTAAGGTTCVTRCTFKNNRAAFGGAIATQAGGASTAILCTFEGNCVTCAGSLSTCAGGAIYGRGLSRSALIQCTLTGNSSACTGGGAAAEGTISAPGLYLLNSIITGNAATVDGADVYVMGHARVVCTIIGARNSTEDSSLWRDVDVLYNVGDTLLTRKSALYNGVQQSYFSVAQDDYGAATITADSAWQNVMYSTASETACLYGTLRLARRGTTLTKDIIGISFTQKVPGSSSECEEYAADATPLTSEDPLCVTDATEAALATALARAAANPLLGASGAYTVTFSGAPTIELTAALELAAFTNAPLRIVGPVVLSGQDSTRLFSVAEKNHLILENVVLQNGCADDVAGAIYVAGGILEASNCTFKANCARNASGYGGAGGAVAFETPSSISARGTFRACTFENNVAEKTSAGDAFGQSIYHDDYNLELYNCTFSGGIADEVDWQVRVCVKRAGGTIDRFLSTQAAIKSGLNRGDVLIILECTGDENDAEIPDAKTLPEGVTLITNAPMATATYSLKKATGGIQSFSCALDAAAYLEVGDVITATDSPKATTLFKNVAHALTAQSPWFCVTQANETISTTLSDAARPTLGDLAENNTFAESEAFISITPGNVKPNLWYGLGQSETLSGEYVVEEWVKADETGALPHALTAPKSSTQSFYKVIAREALE